jgi:MFS family permease
MKKLKAFTHPIYNLQFFLLCFSSLCFSASFNMLLPELPSFLSGIGGAEYKGLIVGLFTLTAGLSRPFSGKLTDSWGRVPIMAAGSVVCFVCGFLYPWVMSVSGFLFLRLLHGFSTGFKPTATAAYVADIVPKERWGEALGIHGLFFSTGLAIGPALGSSIRLYSSLNFLFYSSSFVAALSIIILMNMKETRPRKRAPRISDLKLTRHDVIELAVLPAALVMFLGNFAFGVVLTLIPDWSEHFGILNKGLFFMVMTVGSIVLRFVAGKASDRYGRVPVIKVGLILVIVAMLMVGHANSARDVILGAVMYGFGLGALGPALNAWTIDMSHPDHRGKAVATMYIAMEAGIGIGAVIAGWLYQDVITQIPLVMYLAAALSGLGLLYLSLRPGKNLSEVF